MDNCGQLWTDIAHSLYDGQERLFSADLKSWGNTDRKFVIPHLEGIITGLKRIRLPKALL